MLIADKSMISVPQQRIILQVSSSKRECTRKSKQKFKMLNCTTISIKAGSPEYFLSDHLGSVRTTIDQNGFVIGYDDYYPFGLAMNGRSSNLGTPNDLNKFTGHERDQEGGINLDYMLARNYDPEIGRFLSVDPLHSKRSWLSPYNYVQNNPMIRFDPTGQIDWKATFKGALTTASGFGQVTGGVAIISSTLGIGAPIGTSLIMTGTITTGLGLGQLAQGLSEKGLDNKIPSGVGELSGDALTKATGNEVFAKNGTKIDEALDLTATVLGVGALSKSTKVIDMAIDGVAGMANGIKSLFKNGFKLGATSAREASTLKDLSIDEVSNAVDGVSVLIETQKPTEN